MAAVCNIQHTLKAQHPNLDCLQHKLTAAESAFDDASYTQALAHYQSALRDIYTVLPFKILMQCTRARQAVGDHDSAICDVLKAIEHCRVDPRGYLLAANLYLEQDMLRDALLTCDKGCANADDDMPAYKDLQSMRCKLLQDVYVCNSFISERLSSEIIDQILSLLPIKSQVQLAMTCKHWNTYVFNFWPGIWNTVQLTCLSDQKEHLLSTIPGQQVRHLIIDSGIPWKARERLIANQWNQLESLGTVF
ncbi:hypothetical protein K492DRAFT_223208 [Lichtheimia hyalospora FSU 10163]|nr:hypothetical protein K492DRAFT_223208 [Lichtheimia hyalospora FSU 10163]